MPEVIRSEEFILDAELIRKKWHAIIWQRFIYQDEYSSAIPYTKFLDSDGPWMTEWGATKYGGARLTRKHCPEMQEFLIEKKVVKRKRKKPEYFYS